MNPELRWTIYEQQAAQGAADAAYEQAWGRRMADELRATGAVRMTPSQALSLPDLVMVSFYRALAGDHRLKPAFDSSWMLDTDFAFVNIRACSPDPTRTGRVTDALKILPTMRVSGIHLAPFFDNTLENLYAVDSVRVVSDAVLDPSLVEAGLDGDAQICLLVDAIHTLGWRVGFDLEPHTSNFSRIALANPKCFRWVRLSPDRKTLYGKVTQEKMLTPTAQKRLVKEVSAIVADTLARHGLKAVEDLSKGVAAVRACHDETLHRLIDEGYWTLPSHTWSGAGLPRYEHWVEKGLFSHPDYTYLNAAGEDQREHAFGMLSPYKLFDHLPINGVATSDDPPVPVPEAHALLQGIFPDVQARYGFDFVRLDYVDHVFDSTVDGDWTLPVSDRLAPRTLESLLAAARRARPETGAMAERMGVDVEDYGALGFDLLLGSDVLTAMHDDYVTFMLDLQRELDNADAHAPRPMTRLAPRPAGHVDGDGARRCSVLAAVDTHDSGHPLFWTKPLSDVVGPEGLHLRHFLARFTTCGSRRRPKYEVMGNQDMSSGLYEANNKPVSLTWADDRAYNARYHAIEDVFESLRPFLAEARMGLSYVDREDHWAAWFLEGENERLLCVAALEPNVGRVASWLASPPVLEPTGRITIDVCVGRDWGWATVTALPIDGGEAEVVGLDGKMLSLDSLARQGCRAYRVVRAG
ncbi:MAG: hypothetical protein EB084_00205 [Proteobacteria bacterium]|nr:hypothetical protein [Pseudomonadota bacterium]